MAAAWVPDDSIGSYLGSLADNFSGKNAAVMANAVEDVKKKRAQAAAAAAADQANQAMWNARKPPEVSPNLDAWRTGAGPVSTEVVPAGGPAPLQALTPDIGTKDAAVQDQTNAEFARVRAKQLADSSLGYQHVTSMGDVATNAPRREADTQLDLYGVPKTLEGQLKMQTQMTGKLPMLDVTGTTNNYGVQDPQGNIIARGSTRDGRTDMATGQAIPVPPGHSLVKMGDAPFDQSPYKDKGAELSALEKLNTKATVGQPEQWTLNDQQRAQILLASQFPRSQKVEKDDAGGIRVVGYNEKAVPPVYGPLISRINAQLGYMQPPPAAPTTPAAVPSVPAGPSPAMGAGPGQRATVPDALASTATPGAPAAAAAAPTPIVPFDPNATSVSAPVVQGSGDPQLKEVLNHPVVKGAIDAGRAYNELLKAAQDNTPEGALHMVYMLAKIYDPNSVVREGEIATAQNTSPAMEKWWGLYNKQMDAKSPLSERARASFINEGYKAAQAHFDAAKGLVDYAGERATRLGIDPRNVMPPLTPPSAPPQGAGGGRPMPKVGDVVNGRTFLGGDPSKREAWQ